MNHHAYVYIGNDISVLPEEVSTQGTDIEHIVVDRLAIADARSLKESAYRRPQSAAERHVVVVAKDMPIETQNALLKLLEEPPETSVFHLVVPRRDILLPTVLSRVQIVNSSVTNESNSTNDTFENFANASYKERIEQIDTAHKKKDTAWFVALFAGVESYAEMVVKKDIKQAKLLILSCTRSRGPGASQKMLAEDVSLVLPLGKYML